MRTVLGFCFILQLALISSPVSSGQVLQPQWRRGVVLIEQFSNQRFEPLGTSVFLIHRNVHYLLTNSHIARVKSLYARLRCRGTNKPFIRLCIDSMCTSTGFPWLHSRSHDIAVVPLFVPNGLLALQDTIDHSAVGVSIFKGWEYVSEGDEVYVLGFPMALGTSQQYSPVYRIGIVALKEQSGQFLIDARVYPGNSGGPVFLKPSLIDFHNLTVGKVTQAYFVGIVSAYLPYTDVAVSQQTQRPRVTFEENSGLAIVCSSDKILELVEQYVATYPSVLTR